MVDPHRCIGCKYCIASCPYDVRYLSPFKKIVQKCQWCHHRVDAGLLPACVQTCPTNALVYGDLGAPQSAINQALRSRHHFRPREELGTEPGLYYLT